MNIIKRTGKVAKFEKDKIINAILKAMEYVEGVQDVEMACKIAFKIEEKYKTSEYLTTVDKIEGDVYDLLVEHNKSNVAKGYEGYRAVQAFKRQINITDDTILGLVGGTNKEVMKENSNKNAQIASTQRDLIAGEVSKDIARRKLIPAHVVQAHDDGVLHFHDMDYTVQNIFNCCLINIKDMLDNGTVINGKMVESPKSFQVACTVMTQIIAQVASGQFGE